MALRFQEKIGEDAAHFVDCYREIFEPFSGLLPEKNARYLRIRAFLEPAIYQKLSVQSICVPCRPAVINDTISRSATWSALYEDKPMPDVEENAVEKYSGSLDQYLPDNVPIDSVITHAKG